MAAESLLPPSGGKPAEPPPLKWAPPPAPPSGKPAPLLGPTPAVAPRQLSPAVPEAPSQPGVRGGGPTRWLAYRAEKTWRGKVYVLAVQLILLALLQMVPTAPVFDLRSAPFWARIAVLLAALQIAYACWMWLVPDWSTVWVAMLVLAIVAALYGTALGITWVTPHGAPSPLGLPAARAWSQLWCGAMIVVTLALTYACGRVSHRWHKTYGEE